MTRVVLSIALLGFWSVCAGCGGPSMPDSNDSGVPQRDDTESEDSGEDRTSKDEAAPSDDERGRDDEAAESAPETEDTTDGIVPPDQLTAAFKKKNPGFEGQVGMRAMNAELMVVGINDPNVKDISPLARQRIGALDLSGCDIDDLSPLEGMPLMVLYLENNRRLRDIRPLRGMPLQELRLENTQVEDLGPLRGAPLVELNTIGARVKDLSPLAGSSVQMLWLSDCPVKDISPLRKTSLISLTLENTPVDDISPFAGHSIQRLHIAGTEVTDLTPVGQMRLTRLIFTPSKIKKGIDVVRKMPIGQLGTSFADVERRLLPSEFWKMYDEGKLD